MPVTPEQLEDAIRTKIEGGVEHVQIFDISGGCGQSYEVIIVSKAFEKLPTFRRHKLVNAALKAEIAELHAFSQKTFTPEQWQNVEVKVADNGPATPSMEVDATRQT
ncbi:bola-like protein [Cystobasidium minutum MCA 4210]|uniref:bola-like protein n=1 Tax=Cystobasidium minutum MCA 4210 TaxID=1397322 RepID=UPI0034CDEE5B|eukprot:jgi/Rhomi1/15720/CE15719_997